MHRNQNSNKSSQATPFAMRTWQQDTQADSAVLRCLHAAMHKHNYRAQRRPSSPSGSPNSSSSPSPSSNPRRSRGASRACCSGGCCCFVRWTRLVRLHQQRRVVDAATGGLQVAGASRGQHAGGGREAVTNLPLACAAALCRRVVVADKRWCTRAGCPHIQARVYALVAANFAWLRRRAVPAEHSHNKRCHTHHTCQ